MFQILRMAPQIHPDKPAKENLQTAENFKEHWSNVNEGECFVFLQAFTTFSLAQSVCTC